MPRQAQHEQGGTVHRLVRHPATPSKLVESVAVEWLADDPNEALLTFVVSGASQLSRPAPQSPRRADELWRTTCFEMFWKPASSKNYIEFNLSPSGRWAAYAFGGYRKGMRDQAVAVDPHIEAFDDGDTFVVEVDIDFATMPAGDARLNLCAVIEEIDGTKSYWALAHPDGPPDFHDPACFVLELPAAG